MKYKYIAGHPENFNTNSRNSKIAAGMWDDFVNAKKRMESEGPFLLGHLGKRHQRVFDACLGTGADSIFLLKNGYDVTSNELDRHFMRRAVENSRKEGVRLNALRYDWRELAAHLATKKFDAVMCLGNSLTYLFKRMDQFVALRNFFKILKDSGVLILDTRNYDYILDERQSILENGNFRYSGNYVYCGIDKVHAAPVQISENGVLLEFTDLQTGKKAHLAVYPFRRRELHDLLADTGFASISLFSDYRPGLNPNADFYQFVCRR